MSLSKLDPRKEYFCSTGGLIHDPMLKRLGFKKKLELAYLNEHMEANVASWFSRKQKELILIPNIHWFAQKLLEWDPRCMLVGGVRNPFYFESLKERTSHEDTLCKVLNLSTNLETLVVNHDSYLAVVEKAVRKDDSFGKSLRTLEIETRSLCNHETELRSLLVHLPNLKELKVPFMLKRESYERATILDLDNIINDLLNQHSDSKGCSKLNMFTFHLPFNRADATFAAKIKELALSCEKFSESIGLETRKNVGPDLPLSPHQLRTILTSFHNLSHLDMETMPIINIDMADAYCAAIDSSGCSLQSLALHVVIENNRFEQESELYLQQILRGISSKWPNIKRLKFITEFENVFSHMRDLPMSIFNEIVTSFQYAAQLEIGGLGFKSYDGTSPFPLNNSVKEFTLSCVQQAHNPLPLLFQIFNGFPHLKKLKIPMHGWDEFDIEQALIQDYEQQQTPYVFACKGSLEELILIQGDLFTGGSEIGKFLSLVFSSLPNIRRLVIEDEGRDRTTNDAIMDTLFSINSNINSNHLGKLKHLTILAPLIAKATYDHLVPLGIEQFSPALLANLNELIISPLSVSIESLKYIVNHAPKLKFMYIIGEEEKPSLPSDDEDDDEDSERTQYSKEIMSMEDAYRANNPDSLIYWDSYANLIFDQGSDIDNNSNSKSDQDS